MNQVISITRDVIDEPIGGGAFVYLTVIPFLDFEAGVSLTGSEYNYVFNGEDSPAMGIAKFGWYYRLKDLFLNFLLLECMLVEA